MNHRNVKIGNENFKEWLKTTDPQTRVKLMCHISRTLFAMGHQGTQIKRALAQLSQRCQVKLLRLTDKEIKKYTRRKPLEKLHYSSAVALPHQHDLHIHLKRPKSVNSSRKKQNKKELIRELFGEDDEEDVMNEPTRSKERSDKEVNNYLSTTVHVNYYNIYSGLGSNVTDLKRKSFTENSVIKSNQVPHKKLRIGVSLTTEDDFERNNKLLANVTESDGGSPSDRSKTSKRKKASKQRTSDKKKSKKGHQRTRKCSQPIANRSLSEEDPSIKELWSILGMEAPSDRTAKFFSNQFNSSETITLLSATEEASSGERSVIVDNAHTQLIGTALDTGNRTPVNQVEHRITNTHDESPEAAEPFLKISETFSLANVGVEDGSGISGSGREFAANHVIQSKKKDQVKPSQESGRTSSSEEPRSKIGTIRVKSMGLLVDPQLQPTFNDVLPTNKVVQSSADTITNTELPRINSEHTSTSEPSVEERFFSVYSYYFDELVENKIPELGEHLHLALAAAMRLTKSVQIANQLSSDDMIKAEKIRAEKTFLKEMRERGFEFTPLCTSIIEKFTDISSKKTLFCALFCRLLKQASTQDPANYNYISAGRNVISCMFKAHQYKDQDILDSLDSDEFEKQVTKVRQLVELCVRKKDGNSATNSETSDAFRKPTSNVQNTSRVSEGSGTTDIPTLGVFKNSLKLVQQRLSKSVRVSHSVQGQSRTNTTTQPHSASNDSNDFITSGIQQSLMTKKTNFTPNRTVQPRSYESSRNAALINEFQLALAKQQVRMSTINNQSKSVNRNNTHIEQPDFPVIDNTSTGQDSELEGLLSAKVKETPNKNNFPADPQLSKRNFATSQVPLKTIGIPNPATTSISSSVSTPSMSRVSHAPISPSLAGKQHQASAETSPFNISTANTFQYLQSLPATTSVSLLNASIAQEIVGTSQPSSILASTLSNPRQSGSSLPRKEDIINHQHIQSLPVTTSVSLLNASTPQEFVRTSQPSSILASTLSHPRQSGSSFPRQEDIINQQHLQSLPLTTSVSLLNASAPQAFVGTSKPSSILASTLSHQKQSGSSLPRKGDIINQQPLHSLPVTTSIPLLNASAPQEIVRTSQPSSILASTLSHPRQSSSSLPRKEDINNQQHLQLPVTISMPGLNTSTPQLFVRTSEPSATLTYTLSHSKQTGSSSPRKEGMLINQQQRLDTSKPLPGPKEPGLNLAASAVSPNVRNAVDEIVAIARAEANHPHVTGINKSTSEPQQSQIHGNTVAPLSVGDVVNHAVSALVGVNTNELSITKIRPEGVFTIGNTTPPSTSSPIAGSSTQGSPEVTSPTAEVNLPSSSHCHPFIARRPISGKMKMLFGNNSAN